MPNEERRKKQKQYILPDCYTDDQKCGLNKTERLFSVLVVINLQERILDFYKKKIQSFS